MSGCQNDKEVNTAPRLENGQITFGTSNGFQPAKATVSKGTTLTFVPSDNKLHTVQEENGAFNSGNLNNGTTYQHTFDSAGTFNIFCRYHIQNTAEITVE